MTDKPTQEEVMGSLTGYDEIAIDKHFDLDPYVGDDRRPMKRVRALIFAHRVHLGDTPAVAKDYALGLSIRDVNDYFGDDDLGDVMPEEPDSPAGKDEPEPPHAPPSSPTSVSEPE